MAGRRHDPAGRLDLPRPPGIDRLPAPPGITVVASELIAGAADRDMPAVAGRTAFQAWVGQFLHWSSIANLPARKAVEDLLCQQSLHFS
jgi:hypothetical protein